MKKRNRATDAVERAAQMYPDALKAATAYMGQLPYGVKEVSRSTADRQLSMMRPEELIQLAQVDPIRAEQADQRLRVLEARSTASYPDAVEE